MALKDVQTSLTGYHDDRPHDTITKIYFLPSPAGGVSVNCEWTTPKRQGRRGTIAVYHGTVDHGDLSAFYRWLATTDYAGVMDRRRRK